MKRLIAPLSLLVLVALAGCSSTPGAAPSGSSAANAGPSSPADSAMPAGSDATSSSDASSSAPVAGGTATDFCGAFKELQTVFDSTSGDPATLGAAMQAAAADMRKYAPPEIAQAANTYANVMESIGKAAAGGTFDQAALMKAISQGTSGNAKDIGTTAIWVSKNCSL